VGDTVPPMAWPRAVATDAETMPADVAVIRCDPGVHSIFIQMATTTCSVCPERIREIVGLKSTWETYGAKWVFMVSDAASPSAAGTYVSRYGVDFGWATNDSDNTEGEGLVAGSGMYGAVPWTVVISTRDMRLRYEEPDDRYLDIASIAEELASE
jgi:hypothetical protein